MTKYVLLIALVLVVLWWWRKAQASRSRLRPPVNRPVEQMVSCARCGVNQPLSESTLSQGKYYCCAEHQREAELSPGD